MGETVLWAIGSADGRAAELFDNYKEPDALGEITWRVPPSGRGAAGQRWPIFHPSEADPDAGYRPHPRTITFALDHEPTGRYRLRIAYLTIAPRLAHLEIAINGVPGAAYLRPEPSRSGEIRLLSGLHTTIYADGVTTVLLPAVLLRRGENRLTLTARDGEPILRVASPEAIKRLDRMADGSGLIYQHLTFARLPDGPTGALAAATPVPTVVYRAAPDGVLCEECYLDIELARATDSAALTLELREDERTERIALALPAVAFGHVRLPFALFDGPGATVAYRLRGTVGGEAIALDGAIARRRKWTVYLAPHAHTDIGYTHRQWEVAERLCRNIDTALDLIAADRGTDLPAPPFAYHLDAGLALDHYLATRGERRQRELAAAIEAGRLGVASNYIDPLTQYAALEDLIRNGAFTESYLGALGQPADFAAIVDVASLTGSLPAILAGSGVRYLIHANNQDRGPFRLNGGLHRQSPFYWAGPDGSRILVWLAKMYCELRKVCGSPPTPGAAARGLDLWLAEYERDDYAPDTVLLYGQEADNTDLDPQPADFVRAWNAAYAYPRLVPCDVRAFFHDVERRFGDRLATLRGDGGAYWEDGVGSTIGPTMINRQAQAALPAAERLEALAIIHNPDWAYPAAQFDEAWRQLLLFDEHTWGAFLSGPDPDALLARDQWATKAQMAASAGEWSSRLLHGAATRHSLGWNTDGREVVVYNPHSWPLADTARVEIGRRETLHDPLTGAPVPLRHVRVTTTQAIVEFWPGEVAGLSYRRFVLREGKTDRIPAPIPVAGPLVIENAHYRVACDPRRGCLTSWYDKALGRELIDRDDRWGFGQFLHASGGEGTRLVSNQADLPDGAPHVTDAFALREATVEATALGQVLRLRGLVAYGELEVEWLLHDRHKRLDVRFRYTKRARREKEAAYVAFPLALPGARVRSDSQLGWVEWDRDELPGGCKEWLPVQSTVLAEGDGATVLLASPDIPLFCVGDIVRGRWPKALDLRGGRIFSYVLNNYWQTNYAAAQGGEIAFGYALTSADRIAPAAAFRHGWAALRPLYAQRVSYQAFRHPVRPYLAPDGGTLARLTPADVALSTLKAARDGRGWIARVQELGGVPQLAALTLPGRPIGRAWTTDLLERDRAALPVEPDGTLRVPVSAWGLATVRLELAPPPAAGQPTGEPPDWATAT